MPYRVYLFANAQLPDVTPEDDLSTGEVESTLVDSVGGAFDYWAAGARLPRKHTITIRGKYKGADFATLRAQIDTLKSWLGQRSNLHRRREEDSVDQTKTARLMKVLYSRKLDDVDRVAEITAVFESNKPNWYSEISASVTVSLSASVTVSVVTGGIMAIYDGMITIHATGTITAIRITGTNSIGHMDFAWAGLMTSGQNLVIDSGAQTIRRDGTDEYTNVTIGVTHTVPGWFAFSPATTNTLTVTRTGGSGTIKVETYDQWQ